MLRVQSMSRLKKKEGIRMGIEGSRSHNSHSRYLGCSNGPSSVSSEYKSRYYSPCTVSRRKVQFDDAAHTDTNELPQIYEMPTNLGNEALPQLDTIKNNVEITHGRDDYTFGTRDDEEPTEVDADITIPQSIYFETRNDQEPTEKDASTVNIPEYVRFNSFNSKNNEYQGSEAENTENTMDTMSVYDLFSKFTDITIRDCNKKWEKWIE